MTEVDRKELNRQRVCRMAVAGVYPAYLQKAQKKGRTKEEVDAILVWLTGYSPEQLQDRLDRRTDFETFFREAPSFHPNASKNTGVVCEVRVEEVEDELMRKIRCLDKMVDELAKGWALEKILRT
jgi:hypothetical protein